MLIKHIVLAGDGVDRRIRGLDELIPTEEEVLRGHHSLHTIDAEHVGGNRDDAIRCFSPVDIEDRGESFHIHGGDDLGSGEHNGLGFIPWRHPMCSIVTTHAGQRRGAETVGHGTHATQQLLRIRFGGGVRRHVRDVDAVESASASIFGEALGGQEIRVVMIGLHRSIHDFRDKGAQPLLRPECGEQGITRNRHRIIVVERQRMVDGFNGRTVVAKDISRAICLIEVTVTRLNQTHHGLLVHGTIALQGVRRADIAQGVGPLGVLHPCGDDFLNECVKKLVAHGRKILKGISEFTQIALSGGGDAHLILRGEHALQCIDNLEVSRPGERADILICHGNDPFL